MSEYNDIKDIIEPLQGDNLNKISERIIGCAIEVHRNLGPGLLENIYENALCVEFESKRLNFARQVIAPAFYKNRNVGEYRIDILVENEIIVELKVTDKDHEIHKAQLLTYLRLMDKKLGLLINFNKKFLRDGIKRIIL